MKKTSKNNNEELLKYKPNQIAQKKGLPIIKYIPIKKYNKDNIMPLWKNGRLCNIDAAYAPKILVDFERDIMATKLDDNGNPTIKDHIIRAKSIPLMEELLILLPMYREDDILWVFKNGMYVADPKKSRLKTALSDIMRSVNIQLLKSEQDLIINNVVNRKDADGILDVEITPIMPLANFYFNYEDYTMLEKTSENAHPYIRSSYAVKYDPEAECDDFNLSLKDTLPDKISQSRFLDAGMLCLLPEKYETYKIIFMIGGGKNGKSVLLKMYKNMMGKKQCGVAGPSDILNDFATGYLDGKYANIDSEAEGESLDNLAKIRRLVSGDGTMRNGKHEKLTTADIELTCIFGFNKLPIIKDHSTVANRRRLELIEFNTDYRDKSKRHSHIRKMKRSKTELSGILNLLLPRLDYIKQNGEIRDPTTDDLLDNYLEKAIAPISDFIDKYIEETDDEEKYMRVDDGWNAFIKYLNKNHILNKYTKDNMKMALKQDYITNRPNSGVNRKKLQWIGLRLKTDEEINNDTEASIKLKTLTDSKPTNLNVYDD